MEKRTRNLLHYQCESREEYSPRGIGEDLPPIHVMYGEPYPCQVNLARNSRCFRHTINLSARSRREFSGWGLYPLNNVSVLRLRCLQTPDTKSEQTDDARDKGERNHAVYTAAEDEQIK